MSESLSQSRPWVKHHPSGVSAEIEIPLHPVSQLLTNTAVRYPDHLALRCEDRAYTYRELQDQVDRLTTALQALGLCKGDRAAVAFPNCPEYVIAYYAVLQAGGIVVQVNPHYTDHEMDHLLEDSGAQWMLLSADLYGKMQSFLAQRHLRGVLYFGAAANESLPQVYHAEALIEATPPAPRTIEIDPTEDIAVLQYTGGTTGRSKGVMLTHYNVVANAYQSFEPSSIVMNIPGEVCLGTSPLYHVYGMTSSLNVVMLMAGTLILLPKFDVNRVFDLMERYKPTSLPGVPTMYIALLNHPRSAQVDMTSLKVCNCGSAPMPVEVIRQFEAKTGAKIAEGYGLSEAAPVTHRNPLVGLRKVGSIGIPLPNTDARIVDLETGERELAPGVAGELVIRGPQVMKGYWNQPEETSAALRDGWLHTGDIATMDKDGYFYIVGRKKELIITGGLNVYPKEVEEILYQHPLVQEVAVVGVPDPYRGEAIKAYVVPKQDAVITAEELEELCRAKLVAYKVPRSIEFRSSLPKTTVGKLLRRALTEAEAKSKEQERTP